MDTNSMRFSKRLELALAAALLSLIALSAFGRPFSPAARMHGSMGRSSGRDIPGLPVRSDHPCIVYPTMGVGASGGPQVPGVSADGMRALGAPVQRMHKTTSEHPLP